MSERINDGQLDHANAENKRLRNVIIAISQSHAKLFDMLKEVASVTYHHTDAKGTLYRIPDALMQRIREETDEHEVGT